MHYGHQVAIITESPERSKRSLPASRSGWAGRSAAGGIRAMAGMLTVTARALPAHSRTVQGRRVQGPSGCFRRRRRGGVRGVAPLASQAEGAGGSGWGENGDDDGASEALEERAMLKGELLRACAPTDRGQRAGSYRRGLVCSLVEGLEEGWDAERTAPETLGGTWELLFAATQGGQGDAHVFRSSPVFGSVGVVLGEEASGQLFDATWAMRTPLGADFGEVTQTIDVSAGELTSRVAMSVGGGIFAGTVVTVAGLGELGDTWPVLRVASRTTEVEPTGMLAPLAPVFDQVSVPVGSFLTAPADVTLTYLDDDLRVARQAGALFVYTKSF